MNRAPTLELELRQGFHGFSFEELRLASGAWGEAIGTVNSRVPAERLIVRPQTDGSYVITWTPKAPGSFAFRGTIDDLPMAQVFVYANVSDNLISLSRWKRGLCSAVGEYGLIMIIIIIFNP